MLTHCPRHRPGPHSKELSSPQVPTVPRLRNPDLCDLLNEENHGEGRSLPGWAEGGARGRSGVSEMFCTSVVGSPLHPVKTHLTAHLKPVTLTPGKSHLNTAIF